MKYACMHSIGQSWQRSCRTQVEYRSYHFPVFSSVSCHSVGAALVRSITVTSFAPTPNCQILHGSKLGVSWLWLYSCVELYLSVGSVGGWCAWLHGVFESYQPSMNRSSCKTEPESPRVHLQLPKTRLPILPFCRVPRSSLCQG